LNDPGGSIVVVILGGAGKLIVIESDFVAVFCGLPESRTLKVGEDVPGVVGVPLITPEELRVRPTGNAPLLISQLFVPVPPVDANVTVRYGCVTVPDGRGDAVVMIRSGVALPIISCKVFVAFCGVGGV